MFVIQKLIIFTCFVFVNKTVKAELFSGEKFFEKTITILVNEKGIAYMGVDTLELSEFPEVLQQRLFKSYAGTGKMPASIKLQFTDGVSDKIKNDAIKAVKTAQQNALTELSLQLHKNRYEELSAKQQRKIKRKFPVLFQENF